LCNASRFAVLGDEYSLRAEIESTGCNVNSRDGFTGRALLHEAAAAGHYHLVKMLCADFECNVNLPTMLGSATALHLAVDNGYRQVASLLTTYGADVNARDRHGCSAIFYARSMPLVKLLLRYDVDVITKNVAKLTPKEYYEKSSPQDEFNPDIYRAIELKEEEQVLALKREKARSDKMMVKKANAHVSMSKLSASP